MSKNLLNADLGSREPPFGRGRNASEFGTLLYPGEMMPLPGGPTAPPPSPPDPPGPRACRPRGPEAQKPCPRPGLWAPGPAIPTPRAPEYGGDLRSRERVHVCFVRLDRTSQEVKHPPITMDSAQIKTARSWGQGYHPTRSRGREA